MAHGVPRRGNAAVRLAGQRTAQRTVTDAHHVVYKLLIAVTLFFVITPTTVRGGEAGES